MKTTRIVLSLMVLSMLCCADVFAHWFDSNNNIVRDGNGNVIPGSSKPTDADKPVAHFTPGEQEDPCHPDYYKNGNSCLSSDEEGGHGHIDEVKDGKALIWGYWTCRGYAAATRTSADGCGDGNGNGNGDGNGNGNGDGNDGDPDPNPPPPPPPPPPIEDNNNNNGGNPGPNLPPAVATSLEKISGDSQEGLINTELGRVDICETVCNRRGEGTSPIDQRGLEPQTIQVELIVDCRSIFISRH